MKFACSLLIFTSVAAAVATTGVEVTPSFTSIAPETTRASLEKRKKEKIINPEYKKALHALTATSATAAPKKNVWVRTISSTHVELVTPTVIAGVTFSAKPTPTNGLEKWVSLNKEGAPKTIVPELKNGQTKKAHPTYGTWFATATTITYNKEQLKAHNMADDEVFEEVIHVPEDPVEHELNPLIRCTPERYSKKGMAKDSSTEPFCTPQDNIRWMMDKTYFITWYSNFFDDEVSDVKVHLSYVKESLLSKGTKRSLEDGQDEELDEDVSGQSIINKRSSVIEKGGSISGLSFHSSPWMAKSTGWFPVTIDPEWFGKTDMYRKVLVSIQPDNIEDDDFDHLANSVVLEIAKGAKVGKGGMIDLKKLDEKNAGNYEVIEGIDYAKYYVIMGMPTAVVFFAVLMYAFVFVNKRYTDLSHLKKRRFARGKTTRKMLSINKPKKTELPQFTTDLKSE